MESFSKFLNQNTMAVKTFYLLGEDESNSHDVEVDITLEDLDVLRTAIANHFAIVEPSGTGIL